MAGYTLCIKRPFLHRSFGFAAAGILIDDKGRVNNAYIGRGSGITGLRFYAVVYSCEECLTYMWTNRGARVLFRFTWTEREKMS